MLWIRIPFMRIRIRLITLIRIRLWIRILFLFDADPDPTFHPDAAPDQDTSNIIWLKPSYSINFGSNCGFLFDVDPGLQNDGDSCGSGSTTLAKTVHCTFLNSF